MIRAILSLLLMATAAQAQQPPCSPKAEFAKTLSEKFGETPVAMGVAGKNQMKFYLDPKDRSWTILMVMPQGHACIVATGTDFGPSVEGKAEGGT